MSNKKGGAQIETLGSRRVNPTRPMDYIYDSDYTVSSFKDHLKQVHHAVIQKTSLVPVYNNFFSVLPNYSPYSIQIQSSKMDPNLGLPRTKINSNASGIEGSNVSRVTGTDRYKYFKRPLVPYHPSIVSQLIYHKKAMAGNAAGARKGLALGLANDPLSNNGVNAAASSNNSNFGVANASVQTIYRESDAQTDPYSPEFYLAPGVDPENPPEILALSALSFGQGLPASVVELDMIERARAKRVWESTLPEVVDEESFQRRLKMMEEMELIEWKEREREIERLQQARLELLSGVINEREAENASINTERMVKIWQRKLQERDSLLERLEKKKSKLLRKLVRKRGALDLGHGASSTKSGNDLASRLSIIDDFVNYGSSVYAPKARDGYLKPSLPDDVQFETAMDASIHNVPELKKALAGMCQPTVILKQSEIQDSIYRKENLLKQQLEFMADSISSKKKDNFGDASSTEHPPLKCVIKLEKEVERPPTPQLEYEPTKVDAVNQAVIYMQRHLRGRKVQIQMQRELQRSLPLLRELRIRKNIQEANIAPNDPISCIPKQGLPEIFSKTVDRVITSQVVGQTLDFLNKELVRLREQQRIAAMVKLAERTRRMREAEESGRRQIEMEKLREQDEIFRQVMEIHSESVETYLEDIIISTVESSARIQARELVKEYAHELSNAVASSVSQQSAPSSTATNANNSANANSSNASSTNATSSSESPNILVSNLLSTFLFPHVEKESFQLALDSSNRQYLLAAHQAIYGTVDELVAQVDSTFGNGLEGADEIPIDDSEVSEQIQQ